MSENKEREQERYRLRLSVNPGLYERLDRLSEALNVDRNSIALIALSIGLAPFEAIVSPPMDKLEEVARADLRSRLENSLRQR